jgi:hypothetical protein
MTYAVNLLAGLMDDFISGRDRSMRHVDRIESVLIEHFLESELYEDLSPAVASYRPGGGEHLLDEEALATEFRYVLRRLEEEGDLGAD